MKVEREEPTCSAEEEEAEDAGPTPSLGPGSYDVDVRRWSHHLDSEGPGRSELRGTVAPTADQDTMKSINLI